MKEMSVRWMVFGCVSRSSVGVDVPSNDSNNHAIQNSSTQDNIQKDLRIIKKMRHPLGFRLPKGSLSHGIQRFIRSFKTVSRLFVYKTNEKVIEENDENDEMEIGYPTDVKHLTHIGWDGSTTVSKPCNEWNDLNPSEIVSFPSISLKQFEAAMAQQAAVQNNI
ncbi:hypothetical protein RND81_12G024700 [Saponaria officinalis]|uniref:CRIB domain-containing protein n=1 Tax=Saponaria officinalis TaxID=3572 RepID=A0AAW1H2D6_SAPOF